MASMDGAPRMSIEDPCQQRVCHSCWQPLAWQAHHRATMHIRARGELSMDWRDQLLETDQAVTDLLARVKRVAVLGIKSEEKASQPSFYVPQALQRAGLEIVPVPVYHADATEILGEPVY